MPRVIRGGVTPKSVAGGGSNPKQDESSLDPLIREIRRAHSLLFATEFHLPKEAQLRVESAVVGVLGLGGLGTIVTELLARAGVKRFVLNDPDVVAYGNLNRQLSYLRADVGKKKAEVLDAVIRDLHPDASVHTFERRIRRSADLRFLDQHRLTLLVQLADKPPHAIDLIASAYAAQAGCGFVTASCGDIAGYVGPILGAAKAKGYRAFVEHWIGERLRLGRIGETEHWETPYSFGPHNALVASTLAREVLLFLAAPGEVRRRYEGPRRVLGFSPPSIEVYPCVFPVRPRKLRPRTSRVKKRWIIEIDSDPLRGWPYQTHDFSGGLLNSLLRRPLSFGSGSQFVQQVAEAGAACRLADDGTAWYIQLKSNLRWDDGSRVTSDHYIAGLIAARRTKCGVLGKLLSRLPHSAISKVDDFTFAVECGRARGLFRFALESDALQPLHPNNRSQGVAGLYRLVGRMPEDRGYVLRRNEGLAWLSIPEEIFVVRTDGPDQGLRLFQAGILDATCPTGTSAQLPKTLKRLRYNKSLAAAAYLQIGRGLPARQRSLLATAFRTLIDRDELLLDIYDPADVGLLPIANFSDLWLGGHTDSGPARACVENDWNRSIKCEFVYADYEPNKLICSRIAAQLKRFGIILSPKPVSLEKLNASLRRNEHHVAFCLSIASFDHPAAFVAESISGRPILLNEAEQELDRIRSLHLWADLERHSMVHSMRVPLFQLRARGLARPESHFSVSRLGAITF